MTRANSHINRAAYAALMLAGAALFIYAAMPVYAQTPATPPPPDRLNYQGLVYLNDGSTNFNRVCDVEFRLYASASSSGAGETPLWAETQTGLEITNGLLNVILGEGTPVSGATYTSLADVFRQVQPKPFSEVGQWNTPVPVFVQVTVDGHVVRVRQQFVAAPHAFHAQYATTAVHAMPPGTIMPFAGATVPSGWLLCDGSEQTKADYTALSDVLGTRWGTPADTTKFQLPDLRGRTPVAAGAGEDSNTEGATPAGITSRSVGAYYGEENHTLTVSEMPSHTHTLTDTTSNGNSTGVDGGDDSYIPDEDDITSTTRTTYNEGGGAAHNNVQPYKAVNFIIKY